MAQTTRRTLLGGALAALPLAPKSADAIAKLATAPDPVFWLLAQEQAAWEAFEAAIDRFGVAEAAVCSCPDADPDYEALERLETLAGEEEAAASQAATHALLATCAEVPTTSAGFVAVFERLVKRERDLLPDPHQRLFDSLLESARVLFRDASGRA